MKEDELRGHGVCSICGGKILSRAVLPTFYIFTVERFGVDIRACERQDGLAAYMGSSELARIMGTDAHLAERILGPVKLAVCEMCVEGAYLGGLITAALIKGGD